MNIQCLHFSQLFTAASGDIYPLLQKAFGVNLTKDDFTFVSHFSYWFTIHPENGNRLLQPVATAYHSLRFNRACPVETSHFYYKFTNQTL
jgi:hypothetical protein